MSGQPCRRSELMLFWTGSAEKNPLYEIFSLLHISFDFPVYYVVYNYKHHIIGTSTSLRGSREEIRKSVMSF